MTEVYSTDSFEKEYTYSGHDLGAVWTPEKTVFRLWAPTSDSVHVQLYRSGDPGAADAIARIPMTRSEKGTWLCQQDGDLNGVYYTYLVHHGDHLAEACDPYARTTGVNGQRAMVLDLHATNPEGWDNDSDPHAGQPMVDAVIYELHVRDLSIHDQSGIVHKGKFLGLTETGTTTPDGLPTGLDHIKSLGITHLHLLPVYDYGSVDESRLDIPQFNWGYDPVNYNVPEGSYATDPFHGEVRVREMKQMVKALHDHGISVVMDVVYNHVFHAETFCFNRIVPGYFNRINPDGSYSNGSCCGNDTASERSMVKKYLVDSVCYWADEYHIDGFRFDLVGLIDTETIWTIMDEVHKKHPNVIFYGEGWDMPTDLTKEGYTLTTQLNASEVPGFAFFNDTIRNALKGSTFGGLSAGFVSGDMEGRKDLDACFMGMPKWCPSPSQSINYVSCHDNYTLLDHITITTPDATGPQRIRMSRLAAAFSITAQGVPFFQAGEEMLRSKPLPGGGFDENSFSSSDAVNSIRWPYLGTTECQSNLAYYRGLLAFRKAHPALRLQKAEDARSAVHPYATGRDQVAAYTVTAEGEQLLLAFNAGNEDHSLILPEGTWNLYIHGDHAGTELLATIQGSIVMQPLSAVALVKELPRDHKLPLILGGIAAGVAAAAGAAVLFKRMGGKNQS